MSVAGSGTPRGRRSAKNGKSGPPPLPSAIENVRTGRFASVEEQGDGRPTRRRRSISGSMAAVTAAAEEPSAPGALLDGARVMEELRGLRARMMELAAGMQELNTRPAQVAGLGGRWRGGAFRWWSLGLFVSVSAVALFSWNRAMDLQAQQAEQEAQGVAHEQKVHADELAFAREKELVEVLARGQQNGRRYLRDVLRAFVPRLGEGAALERAKAELARAESDVTAIEGLEAKWKDTMQQARQALGEAEQARLAIDETKATIAATSRRERKKIKGLQAQREAQRVQLRAAQAKAASLAAQARALAREIVQLDGGSREQQDLVRAQERLLDIRSAGESCRFAVDSDGLNRAWYAEQGLVAALDQRCDLAETPGPHPHPIRSLGVATISCACASPSR